MHIFQKLVFECLILIQTREVLILLILIISLDEEKSKMLRNPSRDMDLPSFFLLPSVVWLLFPNEVKDLFTKRNKKQIKKKSGEQTGQGKYIQKASSE